MSCGFTDNGEREMYDLKHKRKVFDIDSFNVMNNLEEKLEVLHELFASCTVPRHKDYLQEEIIKLSREYYTITGNYYHRTIKAKPQERK